MCDLRARSKKGNRVCKGQEVGSPVRFRALEGMERRSKDDGGKQERENIGEMVGSTG